MRVADYIAEYIFKEGVRHVFMVSGGGMMFLSDGIAMHPQLEAVCTHHEQAAAMAAVSYARYREEIGVCYVTTGCGGTNALTGLLNGWQDNIPCLFISGQSKRKETVRNSGLALRQFGVQEADIIAIVQSITKYAVMVNNPELIAYHLDKATFLARNGRPGPVWLDIPLDVQGAQIDPERLLRFSPEEQLKGCCGFPTEAEITATHGLLNAAQRPIIIAGQGIRLGKAIPEFRAFVEKYQIPFVTPKLGIDLLPTAHPLFIGRIGNKGDRAGNMAVQNSDMVLSIGCRLSVNSTGHEYNLFAREAKIAVVDIDPVEHKKNTIRIDCFIHADAKKFLSMVNKLSPLSQRSAWLKKCEEWREKYPVCLPEYAKCTEGINLYHFVDCLSKALRGPSIIVSDAGSAGYVITQAMAFKEEQRSICSGGQMEMGYTLPAAIGVCYARNNEDVIGITGDGSFQMNIQELQTVVHHSLPVKLFVWNNDGYLSIRATQRKFFEGRFIGTDESSGVSFPSVQRIAGAYGIKYFRLDQSQNLTERIKEILNFPNAVLCEVMCIRDQEIIPGVASVRKEDGSMMSKPLEDMYPFLDREEFRKQMIVKPIPE
jgi:acetolactate synthase-1/2/3 large subunit